MTVLAAALRQAKIFLNDCKDNKRSPNSVPDDLEIEGFARKNETKEVSPSSKRRPSSATSPFTVSEVGEWNEESVLSWLNECKKLEKHLQQIREVFSKEEIDGANLLTLTDQGLQDAGITNGMSRSKLLAEITKFKKE